MNTTSSAILSCLILGSLASGCGAMMDTAYVLGDGRFEESTDEYTPTEHAETAVEYEIGPDLALQCFSRTRQIERSARVTKTFEYRGGFEKSYYTGAAITDVVFGGLLAGVLTGMCLSDEPPVSCTSVLWAAPFAVDGIYSAVRAATVRKPVLVDKSRGTSVLGYGEVPLDEQPTDCGDVTRIWLGTASGSSRQQRLEYGGAKQRIEDGSMEVMLQGNATTGSSTLVVTNDVATTWLRKSWVALWAEKADGTVERVRSDRCSVLRPFATNFVGTERADFDRACPLPSPAQPSPTQQ